MNASLTELRTPKAMLKAADAGEVITLTDHGKPAYELRKANRQINWDKLEAGREDWLNADEIRKIKKALVQPEFLTDATVP